jgi:hypothetical protein
LVRLIGCPRAVSSAANCRRPFHVQRNGDIGQALIYMLKAEAWPLARDMANWRADAIAFRAQAANRFVPSMRQRLDLARIYRQARRAIPETTDEQAPLPTPEFCPVTLDELLSDD